MTTEQVNQRIREQVLDIAWRNNSKELSEQRIDENQYNYRFAKYKQHPDVIFVVFQRDIYKGMVLNSQKLGALPFDGKTGELMKDFSVRDKCGVRFYDELEYGGKII